MPSSHAGRGAPGGLHEAGLWEGRELARATATPIPLAATQSRGHIYMQGRLGKRLVVRLGGRADRFGRQRLTI